MRSHFAQLKQVGSRVAQRLLRTELGQAIAGCRAKLIPDIESLRVRLGNPQTILCLGNGPSSEDPRLRAIHYDCLFRVKWRWLSRGFLTNSDMAFVGPVMPAYPPGIFGFRQIWEESRFLSHHFLRLRQRRFEYFTLERTPSFLNDIEWDARPTNGAVMVATAVALQPKCLILAGIDMFAHSDGRYPGDNTSANRYGPNHARDVELQIFARALREYQGKAIILSDILANALTELQLPA